MKDIDHTFKAPQWAARAAEELKFRKQFMLKGREEREESKTNARNERKEPNENLTRQWVQKAAADPIPGRIQRHNLGYCACVFRITGPASADESLSYSAVCRQVYAAKRHRSPLLRTRSKADHRFRNCTSPATSGPEALWVQQLPLLRSIQWNDLLIPATPVTVAIAIDAVTGTVRLASHAIGAQHGDEAAVSAVQNYVRQHGRRPNPVYVDGADFHHSPRLQRVCRRLGIELQIVFSPRQAPTKCPLPASRHQTANESGVAKASPTDLQKGSREPIAAIKRATLRPLWRRRLRDVSLHRTAGGRLPHMDGERHGKDGEEGGKPGEEQ